MRVVMVSCLKYRDCWEVFRHFFTKFWPDQRYDLISDEYQQGMPWCKVIAAYAEKMDEPLLLLQEDFLLTVPVRLHLVDHALDLMKRHSHIGAVRLYPCPGATDDGDDPFFGPVARYTDYRTSAQATIWKPDYLAAITRNFNTPSEFELRGTPWASLNRTEDVWAFRREMQPWPMEYICSAIGRGLWSTDAVTLCESDGIELDFSVRGVAQPQLLRC